MPGANFARLKTWVAEILDYPALNAEFDNILNNFNPPGVASYSANVTQMRSTVDPGEIGTESLAPSLAGEIERLRFAIKEIKGAGVTYWYESSATSLSDLLNAVGGALVNNRVVSGAHSTGSSALRALIPGVSSNLLTLDGTPTPFTYLINGTSYTISTDLSLTALGTAPSSNNTAAVNDAGLTAQESSKWQGEDGRSLYIDATGTEITARIGTFAAFKITHSGNTEYFMAFVKSGTELTNVRRGYFFNATPAPIPRIPIADNDPVTLMRLTWVYANTSGALVVAYNNPTYSYAQPSSPATGDYWYDLTAQTWKIFDSVSWNTANVLLIGVSIQDTTNVVGARAFDLYTASDSYSNLYVEYISATTIQNARAGGRIAVGNFLVDFKTTKPAWDITTSLESGYSEAASTTYFAYVGESGKLTLSPEKPYFAAGNGKGWYHPYEIWRYVGQVANDGSSNFDGATILNETPYEEAVSSTILENLGLVATVATCGFASAGAYADCVTAVAAIVTATRPGSPRNRALEAVSSTILENLGLVATVAANALTITVTTKDGKVPTAINPVRCSFQSASGSSAQHTLRYLTNTLAITVPTSATLGHISAKDQYVWVYLIDDAGVIDIGVSGVSVFDSGSSQSPTAVSGSATSGTVLYSVSAHTSKKIRRIGRLLVNQTTAGTWAAAPTESILDPIVKYNRTEPVAYTPTISNFGTNSAVAFRSYRDGSELVIHGTFTAGTLVAAQAGITPGFNGTNANVAISTAFGTVNRPVGTWGCGNVNAVQGYIIFINSTTTLGFGLSANAGTASSDQQNATVITGNNATMSLQCRVLISGWSAYGP